MNGYGCIRDAEKKKAVRATHVALNLHGRPQPSDDALALHHCDVKLCVNPDHLYWGTYADNKRDAVERGLWELKAPAKGERSGHATLTDAQVSEILASTATRRELAAQYNVSLRVLDHLFQGETWRHLGGGRRDAALASNRGERHPVARLTTEQVRVIKHSTEKTGVLAKRFGVHYVTVLDIRSGRTWKHIL